MKRLGISIFVCLAITSGVLSSSVSAQSIVGTTPIPGGRPINCRNPQFDLLTPPVIYSFSNFQSQSESLAKGDLNGDGRADLAVVRGGRVEIAYNDGQGSFVPGPTLNNASLTSSKNVTIGDINSDGLNDIIAATIYTNVSITPIRFEHHVSIYLANGSSGFSAAQDRYLSGIIGTSGSYGVVRIVSGEFDGLPGLDLAISDTTWRRLWVMRQNGTALTFTSLATTIASTAQEMEILDIQGDGRSEILTPNSSQPGEIAYGYISITTYDPGTNTLVGSGLYIGAPTRSIAVGDITGDGLSDIAIATEDQFDVGQNGIRWIQALGGGTFSSPQLVDYDEMQRFVRIGKLDRGRVHDLVSTKSSVPGSPSVHLRALINQEDGFGPYAAQSGTLRNVAVLDMNSDSFEDVVMLHDGVAGAPSFLAVYLNASCL